MSTDNNKGTPWPVWAAVTLLAAVIGAWATSHQPAQPAPANTAGVTLSRTELGTSNETITDFSERIGVYAGESVNKTAGYTHGMTLVDLRSIEKPYGKIRGQLTWSHGLYGDGTISGDVDKTGSMSLSGTILSAQTGTWDVDINCMFTMSNTLRCTYRLFPKPGNPNGTQDGEFTVVKDGTLP
jgi:hypothetical protein